MTTFQPGDFAIYSNAGNQFPTHFGADASFKEELPHVGIAGAAIDGIFDPETGSFFSTHGQGGGTVAGINKWSVAAVFDTAFAATPAGVLGGTHWPDSGAADAYGAPWGLAIHGNTVYVGSAIYPNVPGGCWVLAIDKTTGEITKSFDSLEPIGSGDSFTWPAISPDGSILYYINRSDNSGAAVIKRWDLVGDAQLSDLTAPADMDLHKLRALANGNLMLNCIGTAVGHDFVKILDPAGTELASYDASGLDDGDYTSIIDGLNVAPDPTDEESVWIFMGFQGSGASPGAILYHVNVFDGTAGDPITLSVPDPLSNDLLSSLAAVFPGVCSDVLLLGTDNGYIAAHRLDGGGDSVVWSGSLGTHSFEDEIVGFGPTAPVTNNPSMIVTNPNSGDPDQVLYSVDGGSHWTVAAITNPAETDGGFMSSVAKDGTYNVNVDEDGRMWLGATQTISPFHQLLYRSTDHTCSSFVETVDLTALGLAGFASTFIAGGWVWLLETGTRILHRCDYSGANYDSTAITLPGYVSTGHFNAYVLNGQPGTNCLVAWSWGNPYAILTIDISDPDNPALTWSPDAPLGAGVSGGYLGVWDVVPLSTSTLVANGIYSGGSDPNRDLHGMIGRSTDGGATWGVVQVDTPNLGVAATTFGAGYDNEINAVAVNPSDPTMIAVALCPPYVYLSTDSGATFTLITIDMTIFGTAPTEWTGIAIAHACGLVPPGPGPTITYPGISLFSKADGVQLSFSQTSP